MRAEPLLKRPTGLTERQAQVLALHDQGLGLVRIARALGISRADGLLRDALYKSGRCCANCSREEAHG